jgi:hypothetical protein
MDDFNVSSLHESQNEWSARLVTIMTPLVIDGYKSILDESLKLCRDNNETDKYLMTFQNLISRIPKWNNTIIESERKRMHEKSKCAYLEDLITCVHIIQLKLLTVARVGQKQKKIDIEIPKLDDFIHKLYINVARKLYKNVYLFQQGIPPLQIQKNNRELEIIVQECIINTIRESIPVEKILQAYLGDEETIEEKTEEIIKDHIPSPAPAVVSLSNQNDTFSSSQSVEEKRAVMEMDKPLPSISFEDIDYVKDTNDNVMSIEAPKTDQRLKDISDMRNQQRLNEADDDYEKLSISDQPVSLSPLDIHVIEEPGIKLDNEFMLEDVEILE